jgi:hypothetical protein
VEVTPGGYRVCTVSYPEATGCAQTGGCCTTNDCPQGKTCFPEPLAPSCSGVIGIDSNVCAGDQCTDDSCGSSGICAPRGTFGRKVRMCVPASCRRDTDCTLFNSGICAPVTGGCCGNPFGLYCVYPFGCRNNGDCATGNCTIDQQGYSNCSSNPLICPL